MYNLVIDPSKLRSFCQFKWLYVTNFCNNICQTLCGRHEETTDLVAISALFVQRKRYVELTGDGNKVDAPNDTPDPANEKQYGGDELEHGDPDVDEKQTRAVNVLTLRARAARQTYTGNKRPYNFILRG